PPPPPTTGTLSEAEVKKRTDVQKAFFTAKLDKKDAEIKRVSESHAALTKERDGLAAKIKAFDEEKKKHAEALDHLLKDNATMKENMTKVQDQFRECSKKLGDAKKEEAN